MADDKKDQQGRTAPLPKFFFSVRFGDDGTAAKFQDVSGLDSQGKPIEFRHGNSPVFSPIKMPGIAKAGNVTLRKGIFVGDAKFWAWYNEIKMNTGKRQTVVVNVLDESGAPQMVWNFTNAWVTKITAPDLKADGNDVAIESLELAHEGIDLAPA
jgi:phage tail-like protein